MLNSIIDFSIKNKLIVVLLITGLIATGIYHVKKLPIDAVPDITNNQVQVITQAPSFGANDIERLVTFPIEQANSNITGLKEIRSFSRFGLSLVTIVFEDDVDIYWARQQVAERLVQVQAQIPEGIGLPELGPISTGLGEIYQYVVKPVKGFEKKYDAISLRTIQDWVVRRQLLGVKGVAEVSSFGGKLKQYEVTVDPDKLNAYGLTINDVFEALNNNNANTGGAYIEKGPTVLYIRSEGLLQSKDDIGNVAISQKGREIPVFIRDVADIGLGHAVRYGAMCFNDEGEVAGGIVMMLKGANSSEVINNVKIKIEQIKKTLPPGVEIVAFLDRTKMVNNAISTVETNLMEGALIVIFILILFLGNWRAGFIVASVIPLSMLFAIILMNTFGVSGNLMSLGALDFGLIVDGAVIIVEAVMHQLHISTHRHHHFGHTDMDQLVAKSSKKMMNSAVFGQLIILIVYLPIFSLEGIEGKMFKPMAQTVSFALLGAFLLSLTYVPMMSALFLSRNKHQRNISDVMMEKIENGYVNYLIKSLRRPALVLGIILTLFVSSVMILSNMGGEFIPELEEGDFAVDTRVLTGSNLNTTIEYTQKTAHILKTQFPEVEMVVTKIGSGEVPTDPMPMEASDMMVILKDKKEWTSASTFNELSDKMGKSLEAVAGVTAGFQYPVQMRFNELMTGARQDVVCKIFGENLDTLSSLANTLGQVIDKIEGAEDIYIEPVNGMPQLIINYKRDMVAYYGLHIADINKVVNTAFAGQVTGQIFEDERKFDLVVRLKAEKKKNVDDVKNLLIPTPTGLQLPLSALADVGIKQGINQIQREDAKRRIVVGFNVKNRDVQSIVNELRSKTNQEMRWPSGYYITYGGAFENLQKAKARLMIAVPVSLLLIFVMLYFAFKSLKHGLLIYSAIPMSAIGGILLLAWRGMPFSISAGVGFIALFGVAVLNGIVLISEFNRIKALGISSMHRIVIRGARLRLRPVLMTAFVASLGFLPMALSNGSGAEVQRPLATVVIGGLLIATLLTLFVLPILYILFETSIKMKRKTIAPLLIMVLSSFSMFGQRAITLQEAIALAKEQNVIIKNEMMKKDYWEAMKGTSGELAKTEFTVEAGQINSNFFDSRVGIVQSLPNPSLKKFHKAAWDKEILVQDNIINVRKFEVEKQVTILFYQYHTLRLRQKVWEKIDSLYTKIAERSREKLLAGEGDILVPSLANQEKHRIKTQLEALIIEVDRTLQQFRFYLNNKDCIPIWSEEEDILAVDTSRLKPHPQLSYLESIVELSKAKTKVEEMKSKPDFSLGVFNTSFRGVGPDNKSYSASDRFTSFQAGINITLFNHAPKSRIKALQVAEKIADAELSFVIMKLDIEFKNKWLAYRNYVNTFNRYKTDVIPETELIQKAASQRLEAGAISFIEFATLINNNFKSHMEYLDIKEKVNQMAIEINFLNNQE